MAEWTKAIDCKSIRIFLTLVRIQLFSIFFNNTFLKVRKKHQKYNCNYNSILKFFTVNSRFENIRFNYYIFKITLFNQFF